MSATLLDGKQPSDEEEYDIKWATMSIYAGEYILEYGGIHVQSCWCNTGGADTVRVSFSHGSKLNLISIPRLWLQFMPSFSR